MARPVNLRTEPVRLSAVTAAGLVAAINAVLFVLTRGKPTPLKSFLIATLTALMGLLGHAEYSRTKVVSEDSLVKTTGLTIGDVSSLLVTPPAPVAQTVQETVTATPEVVKDAGGLIKDAIGEVAGAVSGLVGGLLGRRR